MRRAEAAVLGAVLVGGILLSLVASGGSSPLGVYASGLVTGLLLAFHAAGLVLVYRANRVINFAQIQMSALGGLVFAGLVQRRLPLVWLARACPPCLPRPRTVGELAAGGEQGEQLLEASGVFGLAPTTPLAEAVTAFGTPLDRALAAAAIAPGWMVQLSYWISLAASVGLVVGLVWAVHAVFIKRFADAPRLMLTIATLGAGQFALAFGRALLSRVINPSPGEPPVRGAATPPFDWSVRIEPAVFTAADVMIVVVAVSVFVWLAWFLRRSTVGVAFRAVAENPMRARTLGVNVAAVTSRAWLLAGLFGGIASVLTAARLGPGSLEGLGVLLRALTAAVVGGFGGIPMTVAGAVVIATTDQAVLWATSSIAYSSVVLLAILLVVLLLRRRRASRAEVEAEQSWIASRELRPIPAELRRVPVVRRTQIVLTIAVVALALGYPWFMSPAQVSLAQETLALSIIGLSLLVLVGWAGQMSLGQVAIAAAGAWVAAASRMPFPVAVLAGAAVGAPVALLLGLPALRLRGLNLAIVTLAFASATSALLLDPAYLGRLLPGSVPRPVLLGIDFADERSFYYLLIAFLAAAAAVVVGLRRSRIGRVLIAAKDNEAATQSFGVNLVRARLTAFVISGVMASAAGALLVYVQGGVEAQTFTPDRSIAVFLMTIIGGVGATVGPILGVMFLNSLQLFANTPFGPLFQLLASGGLVVVVVLLFLPGGLAQAVYGMRDTWLRRIASRERIHVPSLVAADDAGDRVPIAPKQREGGGTIFVPRTYRLEGQWMVRLRRQGRASG